MADADKVVISQAVAEVVHGGASSDARVSQFVIELLQQVVDLNVSISTLAIEVIRDTPTTSFNPSWLSCHSRIIGGGLNVS